MNNFFRRLPLKSAYIFGNKISEFLSSFSYLIKASVFFRNADVPYFEDRFAMHGFVIDSKGLGTKQLLYTEMGVYTGESLRFWLSKNTNSASLFFGFDTFQGLPANWGSMPKGTFSTGGKVPDIDDTRVQFKVGLFQHTVPTYIEEILQDRSKKAEVCVYHFDADLYTSTMYSLFSFLPFFKAGDILIFDDIFSITKSDHELRAFNDFFGVSDLKYKPIAKSSRQLAVEIVD